MKRNIVVNNDISTKIRDLVTDTLSCKKFELELRLGKFIDYTFIPGVDYETFNNIQNNVSLYNNSTSKNIDFI